MKIDYKKHWDSEGTCYNQTITIDKNIVELYNKNIEKRLQELKLKFIHTTEEMKQIAYLKTLVEKINYLHLTELEFFIDFYLRNIYEPPKKDRDFERILYRNTIIQII